MAHEPINITSSSPQNRHMSPSPVSKDIPQMPVNKDVRQAPANNEPHYGPACHDLPPVPHQMEFQHLPDETNERYQMKDSYVPPVTNHDPTTAQFDQPLHADEDGTKEEKKKKRKHKKRKDQQSPVHKNGLFDHHQEAFYGNLPPGPPPSLGQFPPGPPPPGMVPPFLEPNPSGIHLSFRLALRQEWKNHLRSRRAKARRRKKSERIKRW